MRSIREWDLPTRLIHWLLVALVAFSWWTQATDRLDWHELSGFAIASLLVWRLYLGIFGASTSRFRNFVRSPGAVWAYLRGRSAERVGHNPIGGWSVIAMLALMITQVALGLCATDEDGIVQGPLAPFLSDKLSRLATHLHGLVFEVLLVLVVLHIAAVMFHLVRGDNLIFPMLSGRRHVSQAVEEPGRAPIRVHLAGAVLALATFLLLWRLNS